MVVALRTLPGGIIEIPAACFFHTSFFHPENRLDYQPK
jgi:hypothetical protein